MSGCPVKWKRIMSYAQKWVRVTATDIESVMSGVVIGATQPTLANPLFSRVPALIKLYANRVRGAVGNAAIVPLSVQPETVPPEAVLHVAVLVAEALISANPNMAQYVSSEHLKELTKEARAWLKEVREGLLVAKPIDPDPNNTPEGPAWGDNSGEADSDGTLPELKDMTTDGLDSTLQVSISDLDQVIFYTTTDPTTDGIFPADRSRPCLAYRRGGGGNTFEWDPDTQLWN